MNAPVDPAGGAGPARSLTLRVPRIAQPDDVSCGPTSLTTVFGYYGDPIGYEGTASLVARDEDGGTLAVHLGTAALRRGYRARIWSWNTQIFDPTWADLQPRALRRKLVARHAHIRSRKAVRALGAYETFLQEGGEVDFAELEPRLLVRILRRRRPILTGLNATYLYRMSRERPEDNEPDDVRGQPVGHFLVVAGFRDGGRRFVVQDPYEDSPLGASGRYVVNATRLVNSILLGQLTYDAVLLEIWPRRRRRRAP